MQGLQTPKVKEDNYHVFYNYSMILDYKKNQLEKKNNYILIRKRRCARISRRLFKYSSITCFSKKIFFNIKIFHGVLIKKSIIPTEKEYVLWPKNLWIIPIFILEMHMFDLTEKDIDLIILAFQKVWKKIKYIK